MLKHPMSTIPNRLNIPDWPDSEAKRSIINGPTRQERVTNGTLKVFAWPRPFEANMHQMHSDDILTGLKWVDARASRWPLRQDGECALQ